MELLHGKQTAPKTERRRASDLALGDNRALSWGSLDSDISLMSHSPLAIADVLMDKNGVFDLVPVEDSQMQNNGPKPGNSSNENANHIGSETASRPSSQQTAQRKGPVGVATPLNRQFSDSQSRANLLTRHDSTQLLKQCKKNLVENALIKSKGDRQLYIAAGFISWQDSSDSANLRNKAPVLLFPALLVRNPERNSYEVRIAGEEPEFNLAFAEHAKHRFEHLIPIYEPGMKLNEYFAKIAESLKQTDQLALEFEVAMGSASLLQQTNGETGQLVLPDIPANFDIGLAMSIASNKSLLQLNAVLQLIPEYGKTDTTPKPDSATTAKTESVAGLRKYAAKLAAEGLDHVEFKQLATLPTKINKWVKSIEHALDTTTVTKVLDKRGLSARELIRLSSIIELVDKAPSTLEQLAHADLCYANSSHLLRRAQHQSKLIDDELAVLQEHFVLDKVPAKSQLLSLMAELSGAVEAGDDLIDSNYFSARRQFMEFSVEKSSHLTPDHRRMLSQLVKVFRFRELFVNNTEYRAALGPGYKGLRTDWDTLTRTSEYARELAEILGSETIAAKIFQNWPQFRSSFGSELDVLQTAAESCRRLLGVVGTQWQKQSVSSLQTHALAVSHRLSEWRQSYGDIENHADKTAAMVLSSFSGKSREDVVVEAQVDDTSRQIDQLLDKGEIGRQQVLDTLDWLLLASGAATEHGLEIDTIVEHLQID